MKPLKNIILLLALGILWFSCTERIDIPLDSSDVSCVIYGYISTDTMAHRVRITRSADYYSNKPAEPISGATVTISDGAIVYPLFESNSEPGSYYTAADVYGVPGRTYTLNVSNVNLLGDGVMQAYTAQCELKPVSKIDRIDVAFDTRWEVWNLNLWAKEPGETKDFYMIRTYINDILYTDTITNLGFTDDLLFNGSNTNGYPVYRFEERDTLKVGYRVSMDMCAITEDYYKFLIEAVTMAYPQIPLFSGPPANIRTNISNNAIGYFAAFSIEKASCIVKPPVKKE
jgi:hypothetical protein